MTLLLADGLVLPGMTDRVRLAVGPGQWGQVSSVDPDGVLAALTGSSGLTGALFVDGRRVDGADLPGRLAAGLVVASCRLDPVPPLRVLDVILLARRPPGRATGWLAALGSARATHLEEDESAAGRALAGRAGLGPWVDRHADDLPPRVAALVDTTRAVAALPRAVVWRRPSWLPAGEQAALARFLDDEVQRLGCAVLEVVGQHDR